MISKALSKKPFFFIGAFIVAMVFYDLNRKGLLPNRTRGIEATSCKSALVMLDKRKPATWKTSCNENNLEAEITLDTPRTAFTDEHKSKVYMYRELANGLVFLAKNCLNESLERVDRITVKVESSFMRIEAKSEGKHVAKLATMKDGEFIANHLQATVKVKESLK